MRLIDADALIEDLKGSLFYSDSIPFVEEAPTAYDVEKVVEELEEQWNNANCVDDDWYYIGVASGLADAIDIVRKGGVK